MVKASLAIQVRSEVSWKFVISSAVARKMRRERKMRRKLKNRRKMRMRRKMTKRRKMMTRNRTVTDGQPEVPRALVGFHGLALHHYQDRKEQTAFFLSVARLMLDIRSRKSSNSSLRPDSIRRHSCSSHSFLSPNFSLSSNPLV